MNSWWPLIWVGGSLFDGGLAWTKVVAGASESTDGRTVGSNSALQATYDVDQPELGADVSIHYVPSAQVPTSSHGGGAQIAPELFAPDRPGVVVVYDQ